MAMMQMPVYGPQQPFDLGRLMAARPQTPQIQYQQPTLAQVLLDCLGKLLVVGAGCAVVYVGCKILFGEEKRVVRCSKCGRAHATRSCPITGARTRLRIEKTGICSCCGKRSRYTEAHHYAGRGVERGREMCGPCHFHCGHDSDWYNFPVNNRYCRLAA
jgi:hypothetical protein